MIADAGANVVLFAIDGRAFALPGARVAEIAQVDRITAIPCDDPATVGVTLHRDRVIPLLDLPRRLGLPGRRRRADAGLCLFVRTDRGELGFPIDTVLGFGPPGRVSLPPGAMSVALDGLWSGDAAHPDH